MATVDVYNLDSVKARTIFSMVEPRDILQTQIICMAVLHVPDADFDSRSWAYFDEKYQGAGQLSRPYMVLKGYVSEVYIEDNDERTFPNGAKRLRISAFDKEYPDKLEQIQMKVNWLLSGDEISYLYSKGLGYPDFAPPSLLRGNTIDIPVNIVYKSIYDTVVSGIRIVDPYRIETSSLFTRYDTLFFNCEYSEMALREKANGVPVMFNYDTLTPVENYEDDMGYQQDEVDMDNVLDMSASEKTEEELSDEAIRADIESKMQSVVDDDMDRKNEHDARFSVSSLLSSVKSDIAEEEIENSDDYYAEPKESKASLKLSDRINMLKEKTTGSDDAVGSANGAGVDSEQTDDKNQNEGFIDSESLSERGMSDVDKEHVRAEKEAKKTKDNITRLDVILDNQALNRGETDISGFGSDPSDNKPDNSQRSAGNALTEELFSDIFADESAAPNTDNKPAAPSNNESRFL